MRRSEIADFFDLRGEILIASFCHARVVIPLVGINASLKCCDVLRGGVAAQRGARQLHGSFQISAPRERFEPLLDHVDRRVG
jgi:hypothetical protein